MVSLAGRNRKAFVVVVAVVVIAVAGFVAAWYVAPDVNYWLSSAQSINAQDNPLIMYCKNNGNSAAPFDLEVKLTNMHLLQKTSPPYTEVTPNNIRFSFTLNPGQAENRTIWFEIDQNGNVTDFAISLSCLPRSEIILFRSSPGGTTSVSYQKYTADANFTMQPPAIAMSA